MVPESFLGALHGHQERLCNELALKNAETLKHYKYNAFGAFSWPRRPLLGPALAPEAPLRTPKRLPKGIPKSINFGITFWIVFGSILGSILEAIFASWATLGGPWAAHGRIPASTDVEPNGFPHQPIIPSSLHPINPSSHHPINPSSHHPFIPSTHHPINPSSHHPT